MAQASCPKFVAPIGSQISNFFSLRNERVVNTAMSDEPAAGTRSTVTPVRVLHIICGLGGGGSERLLWDIVRLSDTQASRHYVVTVYPDLQQNFVYAHGLAACSAYDPATPGNVGRGLRNLLRRLRRRKERVPRWLWSMVLPVWHIGVNAIALLRVARAFLSFRPEVVHTHLVPAPFILGILIRLVSRKPVVHTVPCLLSQMLDEGPSWAPDLYRTLHQWVDYFSTGEAVGELLGLGIPQQKIIYDLGGVDLEHVKAARSDRAHLRRAIRNELGLSCASRIVLSVGRLHPSKGHSYALAAFSALAERFDDVHWLLLGEGDELAKLEAQAEQLAIGHRVHFVGFRADYLRCYAAADVYLRTTIFEPENLSFYSAVAMGMPIIGFETGWPTDPLRKAGNGLIVPSRDSVALANALAEILTLPDCGRALGSAGIRYADDCLDIRQSVSKLAHHYSELRRNGQHECHKSPLG
jgi:glycosyltransferase involved in cell wall biosynthesis